jgi:hypothetical protein
MIRLNPHPVAKSVWDAALMTYRVARPRDVRVLGHVVDLAREEFYIRCEGVEDDPRFQEQGPQAAAIILRLKVIQWLTGR